MHKFDFQRHFILFNAAKEKNNVRGCRRLDTGTEIQLDDDNKHTAKVGIV